MIIAIVHTPSSVSGTFGFVVAFGAGMLSFISPCVLPLVPGYLSMMSGLSTAEISEPSLGQRARLFRVSLLFVLGFSLVFMTLGATATQAGQFFQNHRRIFNEIAGIVIILMGFVLAGWMTLRPLLSQKRFYVDPDKFGRWTAPVLGMAFAFGWTPCIGAVLTPILSLAADQNTVLHGMWLLFFYSLGLGVPFVLSSLALSRFSSSFQLVKRHTKAINLVSGLLLIVFGVLMFTNNLTRLSSWMLSRMNSWGISTFT